MLHSCTAEDYFLHHPPRQRITTLHTGSWIGSNFDIWIGEEDENRAWDLLGDARNFLQERIDSGALSEEQRCAAFREIYAAEGSDWFWWYGPDFSTDNDQLFDRLFRLHLKNVYTLCGALPPAALDWPIARVRQANLYEKPTQLISPRINGGQVTFFKWAGAGSYIAGSEQGAMFRSGRLVDRILFGHNEEALFFRIDPARWEPMEVQIEFQRPVPTTIRTGLLLPPVRKNGMRKSAVAETPAGDRSKGLPVGRGDAIELAVRFSEFGIRPIGSISFRIKVFQDGIEKECYPENVPIEFELLGEEAALQNWIV
jgi:hypothetical protein